MELGLEKGDVSGFELETGPVREPHDAGEIRLVLSLALLIFLWMVTMALWRRRGVR